MEFRRETGSGRIKLYLEDRVRGFLRGYKLQGKEKVFICLLDRNKTYLCVLFDSLFYHTYTIIEKNILRFVKTNKLLNVLNWRLC